MLTRAMLKKINAQSTRIIVSVLQANGGSIYKDTAWLQRVAARSKLSSRRLKQQLKNLKRPNALPSSSAKMHAARN
mgnify:CR=1 FL=1|jgi:hypothetical protein